MAAKQTVQEAFTSPWHCNKSLCKLVTGSLIIDLPFSSHDEESNLVYGKTPIVLSSVTCYFCQTTFFEGN